MYRDIDEVLLMWKRANKIDQEWIPIVTAASLHCCTLKDWSS